MNGPDMPMCPGFADTPSRLRMSFSPRNRDNGGREDEVLTVRL